MPKIMKLKTTWAAGPGHATQRAVTMHMADGTTLYFVVDVYDADVMDILQDNPLTMLRVDALRSAAGNYRRDMNRMAFYREGVVT